MAGPRSRRPRPNPPPRLGPSPEPFVRYRPAARNPGRLVRWRPVIRSRARPARLPVARSLWRPVHPQLVARTSKPRPAGSSLRHRGRLLRPRPVPCCGYKRRHRADRRARQGARPQAANYQDRHGCRLDGAPADAVAARAGWYCPGPRSQRATEPPAQLQPNVHPGQSSSRTHPHPQPGSPDCRVPHLLDQSRTTKRSRRLRARHSGDCSRQIGSSLP